MFKQLLSISILLVFSFVAKAQVGIGTNTPNASAKLDITATNKGLLSPRVALTGTADVSTISSPATALLVYNTATAGTIPNNVIPGYYYFNGTSWVNLITTSGVPYTGATSTVDLVTHDFTTNGKITATTIGLGIATPAASAKLDVTSTTQGFLPPRMTGAQRDAIASSATGLMIYCTNCGTNGEWEGFNGTSWTNIIGSTAANYPVIVGQSFQGGIVAYILQSGDPGYNASVQHGLIAANTDQSTGIQWFNSVWTTTGATATAIGTGLANTNTIITNQGATSTNYAAGLARAYNGGGYSDWYLPSKDELNKLYLNKTVIGGFGGYGYWTSTEYANPVYAYYEIFHPSNGGYQNGDTKNTTDYGVRAIRSF